MRNVWGWHDAAVALATAALSLVPSRPHLYVEQGPDPGPGAPPRERRAGSA